LYDRHVLLGRSAPCGRIDEVLERARQGESSALVLAGEPGVGKSALLDHAAQSAPDLRLLRTRGYESEGELAFAALGDLLRPLADGMSELHEAQRSALQSALALGPPVAGDPLAVCVAALNLLASAAGACPILVLVDDAQWLDRASAGVVAFVGHHIQSEGVALLVGVRRGAGAFDCRGLEVVQLDGLERDQAAELARRSAAMSDAVAERLAELTGGNPLALLELAGALTDDQRSGAEPLPQPIPSSGWAQHVFGQRLAALPSSTRRALLVSAAVGGDEMLLVSRALAAEGLNPSALEPAETAGLVDLSPGHFQFRHPLVGSAVYHLASAAETRSAHAAVAAAMVEDGWAEERAWHKASAAVEPDASVSDEMERAARSAAQRGGYATAARALGRAAMLAPDVGERARLLVDAAEAAYHVGSMGVAAAYVGEAESLPMANAVTARAEMLRGRAEARTGSTRQAFELMLSAATRLRESDPAAAVLALVESVDPCIRSGRPAEALEAAEQAVLLAGGADGPPADYAQVAVAAAQVFNGDAGDALRLVSEVADRVLESDEAGHDLQLRAYVGMTLAFAEEWPRARSVLTELIADCQRLAPAMLPYPLISQAWLERGTGEWAAAVTDLEVAIQRSAESGRANDECWAHSILGWIRAAQGRDELVEWHVARQLELDRQLGLPYQAMTTEASRGLLALGRGDAQAAIPHLQRALQDKRDRGYCDATTQPVVTPDLIEALVRAGERDAAATLLEQFQAEAARPSARGLALRCQGLIDDDAASFAAAAALHEQAGDPFALARTWLLHGERLRRDGHRKDARALLEQARAIFVDLDAEPWAQRADEEDGRSARSLRPADIARDELTASEHQVASLAVRGLQNREIAGRLFMSVKTVEAHLTRIYRKLEVRTRVELVHRYQPQPEE
jgi:DNA-binding CsgD family transcriptional regulator